MMATDNYIVIYYFLKILK